MHKLEEEAIAIERRVHSLFSLYAELGSWRDGKLRDIIDGVCNTEKLLKHYAYMHVEIYTCSVCLAIHNIQAYLIILRYILGRLLSSIDSIDHRQKDNPLYTHEWTDHWNVYFRVVS